MKNKKLISAIMSICFVLGLFPIISFAEGWDGTTITEPGKNDEGAYIITTAEELAWFAQNGNSTNAVLTADIDLEEKEWTPIGASKDLKYSGMFDGNGHTIRGLKISADAQYLGLFGYVGSGGTVKKLRVKGDVEYTGSSSSSRYTGGIAGQNDGVIEYCISEVNVTGNGYCGGITAFCCGGRIAYSANRGNITGKKSYSYTGGIVGMVNSSSTEIENVYNTGNIISNNYVGGLVGYIMAVKSVANAYSTGTVTCTLANKGGCVGYGSSQFSKLSNCYFLKSESINSDLTAVKSKNDTASVCSKTEEDMKSAEFIALLGGMFERDNVENPINSGYPILAWQNIPEDSIVIDGILIESDNSTIGTGRHQIKVDYSLSGKETEDGLLTLAIYKNDGSLKKTWRAVENYTIFAECETSDGEVIKIVFWKSNMEPIVVPVRIDISSLK